MHRVGITISEISRSLNIDRKTVRSIIKNQDLNPLVRRKGSLEIDENVLRGIYNDCHGWIERVHEKLGERGFKVGYSTLTRRIRELGLNESTKVRAQKVPDMPGAEFQHDTSTYVIEVGGVKLKVVASEIYYRYSKRKYLKFYTSFNRFNMKCFFHEALTHFGFVPSECIIDNTNLAIKEGTGKNAIFNVEMVNFAKMYGFSWVAHEVRHSNRKAGVERGFWTVETNFFPGRNFKSVEDLNDQAFEWCEKHSMTANKKTKIVPLEAFEMEKSDMKKILPDLPAPYRSHTRSTDQYGYITFNANLYWVPQGNKRDVIILEYADKIRIYDRKKVLVDYELPPFKTRGQQYSPSGLTPAHRPKKQSMPTDSEEAALKSLGKEVEEYLEKIRRGTSINYRYREIRKLHTLYRRLAPSIFLQTIKRSIEYGLYEVDRLEGISIHILRGEGMTMPDPDITPGYDQRESYLEGKATEIPDLSFYEKKYGGDCGEEN